MLYVSTTATLVLFGVATFILKPLFDYLYLKYRYRKLPSVGLPFIGVVWDLLRIPNEDHIEWFTKLQEKFKGNVYIMWLGMQPYVNIQKPHHMEVLLTSTVNIKKSSIYNIIIPWLGDGLLTLTGKKWHHHRRLLTPAFHFRVLEQFTETMHEKADVFNECLKEQVSSNPKEPVDIFSFASRFTLDVICKTAMGIDMDAQRGSMNLYTKSVNQMSRFVVNRYLRPWYASDFIYSKTEDGKQSQAAISVMREYSSKVIKERLDERRKLKSSKDEDKEDEFGIKQRNKAFLDLLLEASENDKNPLSNDELRNEVDTFMFAGHDTTATAISFTLLLLGNHLDIQKKVHEELQTVFNNDVDKPTRAADLSQLKYLDRVIKETLRLYPSAPSFLRTLVEDTIFDGHTICKGSVIIINAYDMHRDPKVWENPTVFDPDRFLPENVRSRHPYAYIPFSAGPRNCIGQKFAMLELKIALTAILRKWRVKSDTLPENLKLLHSIILRCNKPIKVYFTPID
ncbi:cytochrome P450 4BW5 [Nasonia vitripennis]|uniref:Cytochrome P450 n=1 Tax=Nasonia vitripennis TaxID=7425 RepID=A0A7M6W5S9_NASVI|nr:cytochrome P450 4BW5 [Nasonia vitripennis]